MCRNSPLFFSPSLLLLFLFYSLSLLLRLLLLITRLYICGIKKKSLHSFSLFLFFFLSFYIDFLLPLFFPFFTSLLCRTSKFNLFALFLLLSFYAIFFRHPILCNADDLILDFSSKLDCSTARVLSCQGMRVVENTQVQGAYTHPYQHHTLLVSFLFSSRTAFSSLLIHPYLSSRYSHHQTERKPPRSLLASLSSSFTFSFLFDFFSNSSTALLYAFFCEGFLLIIF